MRNEQLLDKANLGDTCRFLDWANTKLDLDDWIHRKLDGDTVFVLSIHGN